MVIEQVQEHAAQYYTIKYKIGGVISVIIGIVLAIVGIIFLIISRNLNAFYLIGFGLLLIIVGFFAFRFARKSAESKTGMRRW